MDNPQKPRKKFTIGAISFFLAIAILIFNNRSLPMTPNAIANIIWFWLSAIVSFVLLFLAIISVCSGRVSFFEKPDNGKSNITNLINELEASTKKREEFRKLFEALSKYFEDKNNGKPKA